ncbi:hypothetical protein CLCR_00994 [Cladophialophora carrionii]|uniref:Uncharacterized protein n=1 Tax=Cladophialophora carrionii TaxID=86049 RepID=A0A1C1D0Q1_9EURO|nr:hypothetical protein CLCR_00994 [Cladophialophora carrionii]
MSSSGGSAPGEFAHGKVDPHEAGKKGGLASGGGTSGGSDSNTSSSGGGGSGNTGGSQKGEFAHGKVDPSEAGKKGKPKLHPTVTGIIRAVADEVTGGST